MVQFCGFPFVFCGWRVVFWVIFFLSDAVHSKFYHFRQTPCHDGVISARNAPSQRSQLFAHVQTCSKPLPSPSSPSAFWNPFTDLRFGIPCSMASTATISPTKSAFLRPQVVALFSCSASCSLDGSNQLAPTSYGTDTR